MKDRVKFLIISIAVMIIVIITGTFAWLTYRSNKTAMVLTIGDLNQAMVTLKPYQINANIVPNTTFTENKSVAVNVEAVNNTSVNKKVKLYYKINEIDEEDFRYKITRKTDTENSFTDYKNGDFSGAINGQDYEILNEEVPEGKTYDYKVYVWLNGANSENNQGSSFNGELRAEINTNYMKADICENADTVDVFDSGILRTSIETVTFQNVIPNNITSADQPIDVSLNGDNSVIAYFRDANNNSKYEMYIAANGNIVATNLMRFFNGYKNTTNIYNFNYLDTGEITTMVAMFQYCSNLISLDLSTFNTSKVTSIAGMFNRCTNLTNLDLSNWDTSRVTSMQALFQNCLSLPTFNLSSFDTSNVTDMSYMFGMGLHPREQVSSALIISNKFDTSNVTNMTCMFVRTNFTNYDFLSGFNTSNVTNMGSMFGEGSALTSLEPLARWNTSKVVNLSGFIYDNTHLTTLSGLENWDVSNVTTWSDSISGAFEGLTNLSDASAINNWNISPSGNYTYMFKNTPVHPTFTRVSGTWDSNGTFTPSS